MAGELYTSRLMLRPLRAADFPAWSEVRIRCADYLRVWEPARPPDAPDPSTDPVAFATRCASRDRERQLGVAYAHGIFRGRNLVGEMNLSNVRRGPFQSGDIGYWVDQRCTGNGIAPEALLAALGLAFEQVDLHRVEISIIPRNSRSRRVVEKLGIREEGVAREFLEINGVWEDHSRYAMTSQEWLERSDELQRLVQG
ncbi:MAG: GNAT family N-acetyltransferase [Actinomycetia bacterium]|nr:GNAT family N-acetyltransferase [Actinomycetes bacterium]MCP4961248.1 GNAT family N-acetyltransferase [Actinomycetes bacterium]